MAPLPLAVVEMSTSVVVHEVIGLARSERMSHSLARRYDTGHLYHGQVHGQRTSVATLLLSQMVSSL